MEGDEVVDGDDNRDKCVSEERPEVPAGGREKKSSLELDGSGCPTGNRQSYFIRNLRTYHSQHTQKRSLVLSKL